MASLKDRINTAAQSVLTGKAAIRTALLSKEVAVPENPSFQQLANGVNSIIPGAKLTLTNYAVKPENVCRDIKQGILGEIEQNFFTRSDGQTVYIKNNTELYKFDTELYTSTLLGTLPTMTGNLRQYCTSLEGDKAIYISDDSIYIIDLMVLAVTQFQEDLPVFDYPQSRQRAFIAYNSATNKLYYGCPGWSEKFYNLYFGVYDFNSSTLTQMPNCPRYYGASGFNVRLVNNKFYIFLSNLNNGLSPTVTIQPYSYDTVGNTWSAIAMWPTDLFYTTGTNPPGYGKLVRHQIFKGYEDQIYLTVDSKGFNTSIVPCYNILRYNISSNTFDKITPAEYFRRTGNNNTYSGTEQQPFIISVDRISIKVIFNEIRKASKFYNDIRPLPVNSKLATYNLNVPCADEQNLYPANVDFTPTGDIIKIMSTVSTVSGTITLASGNV